MAEQATRNVIIYIFRRWEYYILNTKIARLMSDKPTYSMQCNWGAPEIINKRADTPIFETNNMFSYQVEPWKKPVKSSSPDIPALWDLPLSVN